MVKVVTVSVPLLSKSWKQLTIIYVEIRKYPNLKCHSHFHTLYPMLSLLRSRNSYIRRGLLFWDYPLIALESVLRLTECACNDTANDGHLGKLPERTTSYSKSELWKCSSSHEYSRTLLLCVLMLSCSPL